MRILCVCAGNLCRSPMAELFLREALARRGRGAEVCSRGLTAEYGHALPDAVRRALSELGLDPPDHRSRPCRPEDVAKADLVLVMEDWQKQRVEAMGGSGKTHLMKEYARTGSGPVIDPYGDLEQCRIAAAEIKEAAEAIAALTPA